MNTNTTNNLNEQVAIISGGLGDIGRAIAIELAKRGTDIAIGDIKPDKDAGELLGELRKLGRKARYDQVDVSDNASVEAWYLAVEKDLGAPTLIIPNAAIVTRALVCEMTSSQWQRELDINLNGTFYIAKIGAGKLQEAKKPGRIVFIGSWAAHAPHTDIPAYSVAKAGVRMLSKLMALELAEHKILVNEVAPGYVDAGLTGKEWRNNPKARQQGQDAVPTHELISAQEVASQVAHLCDPDNKHMTGTTLLMDGGLSLKRPCN